MSQRIMKSATSFPPVTHCDGFFKVKTLLHPSISIL